MPGNCTGTIISLGGEKNVTTTSIDFWSNSNDLTWPVPPKRSFLEGKSPAISRKSPYLKVISLFQGKSLAISGKSRWRWNTGWWQLKYFSCSSLFGEMIKIWLSHIFQNGLGWFNHRLVISFHLALLSPHGASCLHELPGLGKLDELLLSGPWVGRLTEGWREEPRNGWVHSLGS